MKRLSLAVCIAVLAPAVLSACLPGNASADAGDDQTSPVGPPSGFGLGFIPDPDLTGPDGDDGGAFATEGVGFSGPEIEGLSGTSTLPPVADLSPWNPPVGNQGQLGSCASWAFGYSLTGWWANRYGLVRNQFSPMFVYSQWTQGQSVVATQTEGDAGCTDVTNCGQWPQGLYTSVVKKAGMDPVVDYDPYMTSSVPDAGASMPNFSADSSSNDYIDLPSAPAAGFAHGYGIKSMSHREVAPTNTSVKIGYCPGFPGTSTWVQRQIANGVPLMVGIPIWPEFNGFTSGVPITPPSRAEIALQTAIDQKKSDAGAPYEGLHEIFCDWYDTNGLWCQNQWGDTWGAAGWIELSWSFVNSCAVEEASAVLTFTPTPPNPVIVSPSADGGMDGGMPLDCSNLEVDVDVLLGPVEVNTVTLYANGTQIAQQAGSLGTIVDGGGSPDAGATDGGDGWADDFVFQVSLDGGSADGGIQLKAVAVDDAGLTGTSAIVTISCAVTDAGADAGTDAGTDAGACLSTGSLCSPGSGSCCSAAASCTSDGVNSVCCFPAGTTPDNGDPSGCCNGNGVNSSGACF